MRRGAGAPRRGPDVEAGTVAVLRGKGNRRRTVGIDDRAIRIIEVWLRRRRMLGIPVGAPLFCTLRGGSMSPPRVPAMMHRLAERAGVVKRVYPHGLRHTHAYELMIGGGGDADHPAPARSCLAGDDRPVPRPPRAEKRHRRDREAGMESVTGAGKRRGRGLTRGFAPSGAWRTRGRISPGLRGARASLSGERFPGGDDDRYHRRGSSGGPR